jgi:hypothetical protein
MLNAERKATTEAPLQAPVWLLPAALDLLAFMAIWTGLAGWGKREAPIKPAHQKPKRQRSNKPSQAAKRRRAALVHGNVVKLDRKIIN